MIRRLLRALAVSFAIVGASLFSQHAVQTQQPDQPWRFAVSGDSRNCGDVVMPAIAATARANDAAFYWHLGDFRYAQEFDEDMQQRRRESGDSPMSIVQYLAGAWPDFIKYQIEPFGAMPVYLGIGNHELIVPRTRELYIQQFGDWLVTPELREQRLKDNPDDHLVKTYYHWIQRGVAFYSLDNASGDMFDGRQMGWLNRLLEVDVADPSINTIVVGMHDVLPDSIAFDHSMSQFPVGVESGRQVYTWLLDAQAKGKNVYILASHLHAFIDGVFNTQYWRENGGVLPGWVVGTAGAHRALLPDDVTGANIAMTDVYGSLVATVAADGTIQFDFEQVVEADVPADVVELYGSDFVHFCFAENSETTG